MSKRPPQIAVVAGMAAALLLVAGCGQRLDSGTRSTLLQQSLGRGETTTIDGTAPLPGATASAGPTTRPGGGSGVPGTTGGILGGPKAGPSVGATTPPGGNGGATDVAVTPTSITVGTVADQTGPQPGLFNGDVAGVRAYYAYVNSQGGIYGRTLQTTVADSGIDCNATTNAYASLADKVFAFVGNLSLYDNCGASVLKSHPKVPDVSFTLTGEHTSSPSTYSAMPNVPGARTGPPLAFAKAFPEVKGAVGAIVSATAAGQSNWASEKQMLQSLGFSIVYEQNVPATQVDFTSYVIGMRQAKVKMALLFSSAPQDQKFINAAQQQGFVPPVIEAPSALYDPTTPAAIGTAPTDVYSDLTTALFADTAEAQRIPGVELFQKWMRRTAPDQGLDFFSVVGWAEASLFVDALKAAGPKATRASLLAALKHTHSIDTGGLVVNGDPGSKKPSPCYLLAKYVQGAWVRWHSPATGFNCDKPYYYAH
jgi:ABC-type branched-subunit amino acid transport system substrate-binding protein